MDLIATVVNDLTRDEKRCREPYYDSKNILSIGVGHNCEDEPLPRMFQEFLERNGFITDVMIDALLERDLRQAERDCAQLFMNWLTMPVEIKRVLLNMAFNMGYDRFHGFKELDACAERGDWAGVVREMKDSKWYRKDVPNRAHRLVVLVEEYIRKLSTKGGTG